MRRFNYDENEEHHRNEVDKFFGDQDGLTQDEYEAIVKEEESAYNVQYQLVRQELNHRLLRTVVRMAENSFWWKFYSLRKQLAMIDRAYRKLKKLEELNDLS